MVLLLMRRAGACRHGSLAWDGSTELTVRTELQGGGPYQSGGNIKAHSQMVPITATADEASWVASS